MLLFRSFRSALAPLAAAALVVLSAADARAAAAAPLPVTPAALQRLVEGPKIAGAELDLAGLRALYQDRGFAPLWTAGTRREKLLEALAGAGREGLDPAAYHLAAIRARLGAEGEKAAELDLLLSDAALRYGRDMRLGRVDPAAAEQDWDHARPKFDLDAFMARLAKDEAGAVLDELAPPYAAYGALRAGLAQLKAIRDAGGWPRVPGGDPLRPGVEDAERVPALRARLAVTGEYTGAGSLDSPLYDDELLAAVLLFQERHGLERDGIVGRATLATLNVPVDARIRQVAANMERWRWLPRSLEKRHLVVNVAAQTLEVVEDGEVALAARVVVGRPAQPTVSFRATITSVTLNPPWRVPASIATREILPEVKKNPGYLAAHRLRILGFEAGSPESEGAGVNWSRHTTFPFQLRQDPGEHNALGRIKFNMANRHDIYLHDTPARSLFAKPRRTLSNGCVRVEEPVRLAAHVIGKPEIGLEQLQEMIDTGVTQQVPLARGLPVYLFYFTAWADAAGQMQFRDDVYGYDKALIAALARPGSPGAMVRSN